MSNSEKENCYDCVFCESVLGTGLPGDSICMAAVDHFYPDGLPESRTCDNFRRESGISIKDKYQDEVPAYRLLLKEHGIPEDDIEKWLDSDSAILERGNRNGYIHEKRRRI